MGIILLLQDYGRKVFFDLHESFIVLLRVKLPDMVYNPPPPVALSAAALTKSYWLL